MGRRGRATRQRSARAREVVRPAPVLRASVSAVESLLIPPARPTLPQRLPPSLTLATPTMSTLPPLDLVLRLQEQQARSRLQEYSSPQRRPQHRPHQPVSPMWKYLAQTPCTDGPSTRQPPRLSRSELTLLSLTLLDRLLEAARTNR